jgi:glucose-6-phosphate-specific signal transduction histidine kinase
MQLSHATAQFCPFPKEEYCNVAPLCCESVPKAISETGCLETEIMWSGMCMWNSVWKSGYTRTCGWLEEERPAPSCHVPLSIQLAVSVRSVPRSDTAWDIRVVLLYWLHRDLTVRSYSTIIHSVYVLYVRCFNQRSNTQKQKRKQLELDVQLLLK